MDYTPTDEESEIIRIAEQEKAHWDSGTAWVTERVAFEMREIVQKARRNYFGIFTEHVDPVTKRKKIFIPFTEWVVETALKNIDIDTKDITVIARNQKSQMQASIFRYVLRTALDKVDFGKILNKLLRVVCIDGTGFLKITNENGLRIQVKDRLNMLYDPSAENLDDSSAIIERTVMTLPEFKLLNLPNSEHVEGKDIIDRTGFDLLNSTNIQVEVPYVNVYERYGWVDKWTVTGKKKDKGTWVYTKAVISNLEDVPVVHTIKEVDTHPFQIFKFKEILNRADGRGIGEMLFMPQAYVNEITNTRLNTSRITQMGLWKIRGNITPQQVAALFETSAIKLDTTNDDIEMLPTGTVDNASYVDEDRGYLWGNRVTGTTQEDELAANRPATNALIQQQGGAKGYNLRMEDLFLSLRDALENKIVPIIKKNLKEGDIVRITGDIKDLQKIEEPFIRNLVYKKIIESKNKGIIVDENMIDSMIEEVKQQREELGRDRWVEIKKNLFNTDFDIKIVLGDEQVNKAAMSQTLMNLIGVLASAGMPVRETMRELFDVLGLPADRLVEEQPQAPPQQTEAVPQTPLPAGAGTIPTE